MFDNLNITISATTGVESVDDVLKKLLDEKVIQAEIKQNQAEQKNLVQERKLLADKQKAANDSKKEKDTTGSPRDDAGLEGMDSPESSTVENQPEQK